MRNPVLRKGQTGNFNVQAIEKLPSRVVFGTVSKQVQCGYGRRRQPGKKRKRLR
jgi:hypothetical protein